MSSRECGVPAMPVTAFSWHARHSLTLKGRCGVACWAPRSRRHRTKRDDRVKARRSPFIATTAFPAEGPGRPAGEKGDGQEEQRLRQEHEEHQRVGPA